MKRSSSFHLLFSISLILITAACSTSFNKSPTPTSSLVPTNTPEPTSTATPQPTVPPEILDLEDRLGNGYQVIRGETGQLLFIQDEKVISEIDVEGHLSFRHGNEVVYIPVQNLDIMDGNLVSIDREKTEEMGVDWVEQVWIEGERIAVPEPVVGLPETYKETLTVKEQSLDYFMPKLLAAENKWLDENWWGEAEKKWLELEEIDWKEWGENSMYLWFPFPENRRSLPYAERWPYYQSGYGGDFLELSSWTRVIMRSGKILDLVGVPFKALDKTFGSREGENFIWHYVFDNEASFAWTTLISRAYGESDAKILEKTNRDKPENIFDRFKNGQDILYTRMFIDAREVDGWEEEYSWTEEVIQKRILQLGFEDIDILMKRLIRNVPNHGEVLGKLMIYVRQPEIIIIPEGFLESMEEQLLPSLVIYGDQ